MDKAQECIAEIVRYLYPPEDIEEEWDAETIEGVSSILERHGYLDDVLAAMDRGETTWTARTPSAPAAATRPS